jgi:excinuclease ABC subunit B
LVVASVSCIYGAGNPSDYEGSIIRLHTRQKLNRNQLLYSLVDSLYSRTTADFKRGNFRVKGDVVDVFLAYADYGVRVSFFGNEIEEIELFDPSSGKRIEKTEAAAIFPANIYVTPKERLHQAINQIQDDMMEQVEYFKNQGAVSGGQTFGRPCGFRH